MLATMIVLELPPRESCKPCGSFTIQCTASYHRECFSWFHMCITAICSTPCLLCIALARLMTSI